VSETQTEDLYRPQDFYFFLKHAHVLGATYSKIRKQNRRGSKSMHNDNNRQKRGKQKEKKELHKGHGSFTLPPIMSQQSLELLWTATSDKV